MIFLVGITAFSFLSALSLLIWREDVHLACIKLLQLFVSGTRHTILEYLWNRRQVEQQLNVTSSTADVRRIQAAEWCL